MKKVINPQNEKAKAMFKEKMHREKMEQMGAAKFRAFMLKQVESEDGKAVEFPDIEETEAVEVGDRITVDDDPNATGTITLKDGGIITYKDGIVTEVDYTTNTDATQAHFSTMKPQEVIKSSKGHIVKIFGEDPAGAFKVGNEVTINDKPGMIGLYTVGNLQLAVSYGKITSIKRVNSKPAPRQLFKKK